MIQPPIYKDLGDAPSGVCSRWMVGSPCGASATHHVIWNLEMENGAVCGTHAAEARKHWVYLGLHPYTPACTPPGEWMPSEDRCVRPAESGSLSTGLLSKRQEG